MAEKYPINKEDELKDMGMYAAGPGIYGMPSFPVKRMNTPITPKENFLRVCRHEMPVWLPNMAADFNMVQPEIMPDAYARNHGGIDWFGIDWQYEPLTAAGMVRPGTRRLSDITNWREEIVWPDLSAIDWQKDYEENYKDYIDPDRATLFVIVNGFFERLADLTSFEDAFCYLLEEPEELTAFYDKLCDFHIELMRIAKEVYHADLITFHDDMGSQRSSFMSPDTYQEIMLPQYQRLTKAAHDMGLYVNLHSCGCVGNQVQNFCDAGFDLWEGQDACNDKVALLEQYGDRLGQVSICMLDPDMSDEEAEKLIDERIKVWGKDGRYVIWFGDMKQDRSFNAADMLYLKSREYYLNK